MAVINGTEGGDNLSGTAEDDIINGLGGNDRLIGMQGNDVVNGDAGDDELHGSWGNDTLNGGDGFDIIAYLNSDAAVTINLGTGQAEGGFAAGDQFSGVEGVSGSQLNDQLWGDAGANTLLGIEGDDRLIGMAGDDVIDGGAGNDELHGSWGADMLIGGEGIDVTAYLNSDAGVTVNLATGQAEGGFAAGDQFSGIEGISGSQLNDVLTGDAGANTLSGIEGDDILTGGAGADTLNGGDGLDFASYEGSAVAVTVNLAAGTASGGDADGDTLSSIENLRGSAFDDTLIGNEASNIIIGGAGNDLLGGFAGADQLVGGDGIDRATYTASAARVVVDLLAGTGSSGDAEGDTLSGIENVSGSAFNDYLAGAAGTNILDGGAGDDGLGGSAGADTLIGGDGVDMADYITSAAKVVVNLNAGTASGGYATGDTLTGIENLRGSAFNDTLTGDAGANRLSGMDGTDVLNGGAGNDRLIGGAGADVLNGWEGTDTAVYDNASTGVTVNLANISANTGDAAGDTYRGIENVYGSSLDDVLTGDGQWNSLYGWTGNDRLDGGAGADILVGGGGADTFVFSSIGDADPRQLDRVNDFSSAGGDKIDVSGITSGEGTFIGTEAFSHTAGEVRFVADAAGTNVYIDANGDGLADAGVRLLGVASLTSTDFVL